MPKLILGFAGKLASGKAVCQKYITEKYGADNTRYSTMLRDILNRLYLPVSRENMQNLSLDLRNRFGGDILAKVAAEDIKSSSKDIVVVDGIRRLEDLTYLQTFPGFYLVSIDATPETRYERMKLRNENAGDAEKTFEQFIEDGSRESELQIPTTMEAASFHLDNNGTQEDLYTQIDKMIATIEN